LSRTYLAHHELESELIIIIIIVIIIVIVIVVVVIIIIIVIVVVIIIIIIIIWLTAAGMSYQEAGFDSLEEGALHVIPSHHRLADHAEAVAHSKGLPQLVGPAGGMRLQGAKGSLRYWQYPMQLCL